MLIVERVAEAVVFLVALRAAMALVDVPRSGPGRGTIAAAVRGRRRPVVAVVITAALIVGAVLEYTWPDARATLAPVTGRSWWHDLTAPFFQGNGLAGTVFNIVSAAVVVALAEWYWGRVAAAVVWLVGAWAPLGALDGLIGYRVPAENVVAYSSGSSGATYFAVGTLCVAAALFAGGRGRPAGLGALGIAVVMWLVLGDGHGVVLIEGGVLGLLLVGARIVVARTRTRVLPPVVGPDCRAGDA